MMNRERIAKWDNLRFFLILCVVAGHVYSTYDSSNDVVQKLALLIYSFHMPAFLFVSGLFSKKTIDEKRFDRVFQFLILFLIIKYTRFLMTIFLEGKYRFSYHNIPDVSWYAFAMLVFYLFTMWIRHYNPMYMMIFAITVSCFSGYASDIGSEFSIGRILAFYPFFLAGYYLKAENILKITEKKEIKVLSFFALICLCGVVVTKGREGYWLMELFRGKNSYRALGEYTEIGGFLRLGWFILAMLITIALLALVPNRKKLFTKWGSRTMQVYAFHFLLIDLFFAFYDKTSLFHEIGDETEAVFFSMVALIITVILSIKPLERLTMLLVSPQKKKGERM